MPKKNKGGSSTKGVKKGHIRIRSDAHQKLHEEHIKVKSALRRSEQINKDIIKANIVLVEQIVVLEKDIHILKEKTNARNKVTNTTSNTQGSKKIKSLTD